MSTSRFQVLLYIAKRLLNSVFVLLILSFMIFSFVRAIPGDPVQTLLGEEEATPEQYQKLRAELGLDRPVYIQYANWLGRILKGEFGTSIHSREPVLTIVIKKFQATVELAVVAVLLGSIFGVVAGTLSAVKKNSFFDNAAMVSALAGISMPVFWMGLLLIIAFSVKLDWLPISGIISYDITVESITGFMLLDSVLTGNGKAFRDIVAHLILPAIEYAV